MLAIRVLIWLGVFARAYFEMTRRDGNLGLFMWVFGALNAVAFVSLPWVFDGEPAAIIILVSALVLAYPWFIAKAIAIRFGLWRLSFALGWFARVIWGSAGHGALVAGAWALHRQKAPSKRGLDFLYRRIQKATLSGPSVLAAGLHASARGDADGAREILESMSELEVRTSKIAHRLAGDFLIADAAERGEWVRVRRLASTWIPRSRTARFLHEVARRMIGESKAINDASLVALWAITPKRRKTRAVLVLALRSKRGEAADAWTSPEPVTPPTESEPLLGALGVHLSLVGRGYNRVELEDLIVLGRSWDVVDDGGVIEDFAFKRAADLQSREPARVSAEFRSEIDDDIAQMIRQSKQPLELLPEDSETLQRAAAVVREEILTAVELGFGALEDRTNDKRSLPAIDEWREFRALRADHATLAQIGGLSVRQLVFPNMHHAACNHAAWLWNERDEYELAGAMFRWLLAEANVVGDQDAIELQSENCGVVDRRG